MSFGKRRRRWPPRADEVCTDDDAGRFFFDLTASRPDHRVHSLCRQVQEAVDLALAEVDGDALTGAWVASVSPASGAGRLLVSVGLAPGANGEDAEAALGALVSMKPWLRSEVARAIYRKRVPELEFRVVLDFEVTS